VYTEGAKLNEKISIFKKFFIFQNTFFEILLNLFLLTQILLFDTMDEQSLLNHNLQPALIFISSNIKFELKLSHFDRV
jgi:hypothetical protein